MITGALLNFFYAIVAFLVNLLPTSTGLPVAMTNALVNAWTLIQGFSFIIPVDALLACIAIGMTFHVGILSFKIFHWVIGKIRGSH